jgi:type I restriction enzyme S subunit
MTARSGWHRVKFGQIAESITVRVDDPSKAGVDRYVGLEHLDPDSLEITRWGAPTDVEATKLRFLPGDIIFGRRRAYQRKLAVADFEGICSAHALVIRAKPSAVLPEFLPFFMQGNAFFERALAISVGSLSPTINWTILREQEFELPAVGQQRELSDLLWACEMSCRSLARLQAANSTALASLLDRHFRAFSSKTVAVGELGDWFSGGTPNRGRAEYWDGDIPWASPKDMKVDVLHDTQEHVTVDGARNGTRMVREGAIFVVVRGMILAHSFPVAIAGRQMAFNQDMKALEVSGNFLERFVFLWFKNNRARCRSLATDSSHGTKRVPTQALFDLKIPAPPLQEQQAIVDQASLFQTVDRYINSHREVLQAVKSRLLNGEPDPVEAR